MKSRSRLVWKLSAVVVAILTAAITLSGYLSSLIAAHYSLESSRAFLRFNSESIVNGIGQLMMSRNNQGIGELITQMSQKSEVYGDIQMVSHHSGEVVVCRFGRTGETIPVEDSHCAVCHSREDLRRTDAETHDEVLALPDGGRALSVVTPIVNEPRCRSAACHVHTDSPPILGFLHAHYSLRRTDAMVSDRRILMVVTVLSSLVLGIVALRFMFARLLDRPIHGLIAGTEQIAARQFDFRFDQKRQDEIGVLQESFNAMTATIQVHQEELRTAKERLEGVIEDSPDIIIAASREGLVETFNRGAEQALGYCRDEVIGKPIEILFADASDWNDAIEPLTDAESVRNYETRFLANDGQVRNVLLTLSLLRDQQGTVIGTFGIGKDITQEKELQRKLAQSQKFAAIGQAMTAIQHAIKNTLHSLRGGTYLAQDGMTKDDPRRVEEGWTMVKGGIERIGNLSEHMLDYAREWQLELQSLDLDDLMTKIEGEHRPSAAEKGVALRSEVRDGLPAVFCDPKLIHMAVTDLVVNAIDACASKNYPSGESPEVVLRNSLADGGDFFAIEIRDNGCGMNEKTRRNIFTPFFTTKKAGGTGLGLALTAKVINVHGGDILVESEPDRGTTFRVHLPIGGPRDRREAVGDQKSSSD
jgi:PAS domain S-box-containing protein